MSPVADGRRQPVDSARTIAGHPSFEILRSGNGSGSLRARRHRETDIRVLIELARLVRRHRGDARRLLDVTAGSGLQTVVFADQLKRPEVPVIYDWRDTRHPAAVKKTIFESVDLERAAFPAATAAFDIVVWHLNLVTLKNAVGALTEATRVLQSGGLFLLSVPNLAALHNRILLAAGRQPTTLHIANGDHVRGFAPRSMTAFLRSAPDVRLLARHAVGLPPVSSGRLPSALRNLGHTMIWVLRKEGRRPD